MSGTATTEAAHRHLTPSLFRARVMHLRVMPGGTRTHRFRYSVFRFWLDIDRLSTTFAGLRLAGHNRFNIFGFYERDHGPRDGSALRPWVETLLAREGVETPATIMLYCFPRMLGYEFNPLAVYFAYDAQGNPTGIVYQVRNTDGDLSPYTVNLRNAGPRHTAQKDFYVSPFIDNRQQYAFTLDVKPDHLNLRIRLDGSDGLTMIASENARSEPLTNRTLLSRALCQPFMTLKITAGIYFEAVRLRLKGAEFYKHPGNNGRYAAANAPYPVNTARHGVRNVKARETP